MRRYLFGFVLLAMAMAMAMAAAAASQATVDIGSFPIPLHVESDREGIFIVLTREIAQRTRTDLTLHITPPKRALANFANQTMTGLFPALDVSFEPGQKFIRTREAIDCKEDFIFTVKGQTFLRTLADLQGKRVGITRGYPYAREVTDHHGFTLEPAASDHVNIEKLLAGRLDAFVLDEKTGLKAFAQLGASQQMQYQSGMPVSRQEVYYAFQSTPDGQRLADAFSGALREMKADGRYKAITHGITFINGCPH
ncbi:MAG: amino acid transporter substrate-binding protein family [Rhodoferax sp.]|nr:amino acid transporter substrate-binding protein family [Rhodoferax sp.]